MSSRKNCSSCKKNFGKSSYYLHLPCSSVDDSQLSAINEYVFCDHCNQRVGRSTYYEHQSLYSNTSEAVLTQEDEIPCFEDDSTYQEDSEEEIHHQNEEDQAFYSESDSGSEGGRESETIAVDPNVNNNPSSNNPSNEQVSHMLSVCMYYIQYERILYSTLYETSRLVVSCSTTINFQDRGELRGESDRENPSQSLCKSGRFCMEYTNSFTVMDSH